MPQISISSSKIDVVKEDVDWAIEENDILISQLCQDVKTAYRALDAIAYYSKDSDKIDKSEKKIIRVIKKMVKEIAYLQTQLTILEQKTNKEIIKDTPCITNEKIFKITSKTMNALLDEIETQYIMIPYLQRIGVDTSYLTSKLSGTPLASDGDKNN